MEVLDALRGFALFGILLVNMALFSWPVYDLMMGQEVWTGLVDQIADWLIRFFAEGKFYALFSFLFGLGMTIQMERAAARGAGFAGLYCRRLLVLLGIGLLHEYLLWEGDILVAYALLGFLLLAFRNRKPKTLLIWVVICMVLPLLVYAVFYGFYFLAALIPETAGEMQQGLAQDSAEYARKTAENLRVFREGTFAEIFVQRARNVSFLWQFMMFTLPMIFAMFLLGLYAGRRRIFQDLAAHPDLVRKTLIYGFWLGIPANAIYATCFSLHESQLSLIWMIAAVAIAVGGPALALAYAASITLCWQRGARLRILQFLAAAGRMALTNYLLQSLICTTIFYSYGLGLYGSVGRLAGLGIAVAVFVAQVGLSVAWFRHFRFGPVEWLWRTLTYGRRPPMRIAAGSG